MLRLSYGKWLRLRRSTRVAAVREEWTLEGENTAVQTDKRLTSN